MIFRIYLTLAVFLVFFCCWRNCEGSRYKNKGLIPLGWEKSLSTSDKFLKKILQILKKISWYFPEEDGDVKHFGGKNSGGASKHWQLDLISVLQDIVNLANSDDEEDKDHSHQFRDHHRYHHNIYRGLRKRKKPSSNVFAVVAILIKNNVRSIRFNTHSPIQTLVKHFYKIICENLLNTDHVPGFSDIIQNVVHIQKLAIPGLHFMGSINERAWSDNSYSSSTSSESDSPEKVTESQSFLRKFYTAVTKKRPLFNQGMLFQLALQLYDTKLFKSIVGAYKRCTGHDLDDKNSGVDALQKVQTVTDWIEKTLLPCLDQFAGILTFPLSERDLQEFWTWPFKI